MELIGQTAIYLPSQVWVVIESIKEDKVIVKFPDLTVQEVSVSEITINQKPLSSFI